MPVITARRYDTQQPVCISFREGRIERIVAANDAEGAEGWPLVAPALVDLQVNGYAGTDFNDAELTVADVESVGRGLDAVGVGSYCPTCTTASFETLHRSLGVLGQAIAERPEVARRVCGIHLEGPYLSAEDGPRGAHPREHIRPPDWEEFARFQEAARGQIRLVTLAPEHPGAIPFIRRLVADGVLVAIGHTAANSDQIRAAVDAGARMSTHLGNGAHGQIRRHPNYLWDQLAEDRLTASLIADGHHLPPAVLKSFVRGKSTARCVLVSDITGMGNMPPGRYQTSLGDVEVLEDGRLVVGGQRQYLAGAALPLTHCVSVLVRDTDVDLPTALELASVAPARLIGAPVTRLEAGSVADLILFAPLVPGEPLEILETWNAGERVFAAGNAQG